MIPFEQTYDGDMMRMWGIISELSEQLNQTRSYIASLRAHAFELKAQAVHANTGFALRRFNMQMKKEEYETELSRMNIAMSQENQALQNDNKQLSLLLKEYEQALETILAQFRQRAHDAQVDELNMARDYEAMLLERESSMLAGELESETLISETLSRISSLLRKALRAANGEKQGGEIPKPVKEGRGYSLAPVEEDWALERECELVRLEKENEELRLLLGVGLDPAQEREMMRRIVATRHLDRPPLLRSRDGGSLAGYPHAYLRSMQGWVRSDGTRSGPGSPEDLLH